MRLLLDPTAGEGGADESLVERNDVVHDETPEQPTAEAPPETPTEDGVESAPEPAPAPENPAQEWQSIRDATAQMGFEFGPEVKDDRQALQRLLQEAARGRQEDLYGQIGRKLALSRPVPGVAENAI